jgi:hypothetical protein
MPGDCPGAAKIEGCGMNGSEEIAIVFLIAGEEKYGTVPNFIYQIIRSNLTYFRINSKSTRLDVNNPAP